MATAAEVVVATGVEIQTSAGNLHINGRVKNSREMNIDRQNYTLIDETRVIGLNLCHDG